MADATATEILIAGNGNMNGNGVFGTVTVTDADPEDGSLFTGGDTITIDGVEVASYTFDGTFELDGVTYALVTITDDGGDGSLNGTHLAIPEDGTTTIPNGSTGLNNPADVDADGTIDSDLCFARGTMIATPDGERAVEALKPGDLVSTWDGRDVELLWIGANKRHPFTLRRNPQIAPIEIAPGALGPNTPDRTLLVSPDHALHIHDPLAELTHDSADVIVEAEALLGRPGILRAFPERGVEYFVLLCKRHELLIANGAAAESLYPTRQALRMMTGAQLDEIEAALPGFRADPSAAIGPEVLPRLGRSDYAALREAAAA